MDFGAALTQSLLGPAQWSQDPGLPGFTTIQEFVELVPAVKGVSFSEVNGVPDLLLDIDLSATSLAIDAPITLDVDLGPFGSFESSSTISLTPTIDFSTKLGIVLTKLGRTFDLSNATFLDDLNRGAGVITAVDDGRVTVRELLDGAQEGPKISIEGSAELVCPVALTGALAGVNPGTFGTPTITSDVDSVGALFGTGGDGFGGDAFSVSTANFDALANLENLSTGDVIAALRTALGMLAELEHRP